MRLRGIKIEKKEMAKEIQKELIKLEEQDKEELIWTLLLSEVPDQNFRDVKKLMTKR